MAAILERRAGQLPENGATDILMPGWGGRIGSVVSLVIGAAVVSFAFGSGPIEGWADWVGVLVVAGTFKWLVWPRCLGFGWPWPDRGDPMVHGWMASGIPWLRGLGDFPRSSRLKQELTADQTSSGQDRIESLVVGFLDYVDDPAREAWRFTDADWQREAERWLVSNKYGGLPQLRSEVARQLATLAKRHYSETLASEFDEAWRDARRD